MANYKGHHKRDEFGNVLSRSEESRKYRLRHPDQCKKWNAKTRNSVAGEQSHKRYNESDKGRCNASDGYLKRKYGKGLDGKKEQWDLQNGLCGVCQKPMSINMRECHWDHHHATGVLREILHPRCNIAVGFLESDIHLSAVEYIKRHNNA